MISHNISGEGTCILLDVNLLLYAIEKGLAGLMASQEPVYTNEEISKRTFPRLDAKNRLISNKLMFTRKADSTPHVYQKTARSASGVMGNTKLTGLSYNLRWAKGLFTGLTWGSG